MTRTDSFVVGTLVVLLALVAGLVGLPALSATTSASATESPAVIRPSGPYREGVMGRPVSISPLTARSQADRDLVALIFSGLVRNGPGGTLVPDLADTWSVDKEGKVWTFHLRDDATWQDGIPVTAQDVVFTIRTLQDPAYMGPAAGSWSEVVVRAIGERTVTFTLATPLGGFLQAATQPIAPAHLLADVPVEALADHPFGTPTRGLRALRPRRPRPFVGESRAGHGDDRRRGGGSQRQRGLARDAGADPATRSSGAVPVRHRVHVLR